MMDGATARIIAESYSRHAQRINDTGMESYALKKSMQAHGAVWSEVCYQLLVKEEKERTSPPPHPAKGEEK